MVQICYSYYYRPSSVGIDANNLDIVTYCFKQYEIINIITTTYVVCLGINLSRSSVERRKTNQGGRDELNLADQDALAYFLAT